MTKGGRIAALAIAGAGLAVPALALHAYRAAAPLLALAAVLALADHLRRRRPLPVDPTLALLLAVGLGWCAATLLWSVGTGGIAEVLRVALLLAAALALVGAARALPPAEAAIAGRALLIGIGIGGALSIVEAATGAGIKSLLSDRQLPMVAIKAGSTVLVVLVWPAVAIAADRGRTALAFLLAAAIALPLPFMDGRAALVAFAAGALAFAAGRWAPRAAAAALAVGNAILVLAAPFAARDLLPRLLGGIEGGVLPFTAAHRVEIWRFAASHALERPFAGWGFDAARDFPGAGRVIDAASGATQMPLHPHNFGLQWWLELGVVGALLGVLLVAMAARAAARRPTRAGRAGALATLAAAVTVSALSYGAWQTWWLAVLGLAGAFAALDSHAGREDTRS